MTLLLAQELGDRAVEAQVGSRLVISEADGNIVHGCAFSSYFNFLLISSCKLLTTILEHKL